MRQRIFFRTLLGAQFLVFLLLFGIAAYSIWLTYSSAIQFDPDPTESIHGLRLRAVIFFGLSLVWGISFLGLLRRKTWGWWLGLICNSFGFAFTAWALVSILSNDAFVYSDDYLVPGVFLIITLLQLLVRPTTWRLMEHRTKAPVEVQHSAGSGI